MKKKIGLLIVLAFVLSVIFSIASQASFVQTSISQKAVALPEPSPTPFFYDPSDTSKVLITVNCGEGGTVTPNGKSIIDRGSSVDFIFTPNKYYEVDKVTVAHGDDPASEVVLKSYKYTEYNIDNNLTVNVTFKPTGNMVNGLKVEYLPEEPINFSAVGSRMDNTNGIVDGSSRWKPIGYRFDDSTDWSLFDIDFSGKASASNFEAKKHNLYVIFARQIFQSSVGWTYQAPADTSSMSLTSNKKGKMKLTATSNIDFAIPFNPGNYVVDECRFEFQVVLASTAPTIEPTKEPVIITPTPKPEDKDNGKPDSSDKKIKLQNKKPDKSTPATGDNTTILPWLILTLVAGLGVIVFSRKAICRK